MNDVSKNLMMFFFVGLLISACKTNRLLKFGSIMAGALYGNFVLIILINILRKGKVGMCINLVRVAI